MNLAALLPLLAVGAGGFIGSILRYVVGALVQRGFATVGFPYGTLVVNLLGCFLIGLLADWPVFRNAVSGEVRLLVVVGLLGGFTTFSSFGYEAIVMVQNSELIKASAYVFGSVVLGLGAVRLGMGAAQML